MSAVQASILCRRPLMNTWFEFLLHGEDSENLGAAGEAALDEVERVEKLLSRFDAASEVSRINREAFSHPVLVDIEMAAILTICRDAWLGTRGFFDIAASRQPGVSFAQVAFDEDTRMVQFKDARMKLDFGAFGKGYALDRAAELLREVGIRNAILHGGTSSVLAMGHDIDGKPWRIGLRDPGNSEATLQQLPLTQAALSTSATGKDCNILDPHCATPVENAASCTVIARTAATAEIYSTALVSAGKSRANEFACDGMQVIWIVSPANLSHEHSATIHST